MQSNKAHVATQLNRTYSHTITEHGYYGNLATYKRANESLLALNRNQADLLTEKQQTITDWRTRYTSLLAANQELVAKVKELRAAHTNITSAAALHARISHLERQLANADATLTRALATNKTLADELNQAMQHLMELTIQGLKDNASLDKAIKTLHNYICFFHTASITQPPAALADTIPYNHPMRQHPKGDN